MMKINYGSKIISSKRKSSKTKENFQEAEEKKLSCKSCLWRLKENFKLTEIYMT